MNVPSRRNCVLATFVFLLAASIITIYITPVGMLTHYVSMINFLPLSSNVTTLKMLENLNIAEDLSAISKMVKVAGVDCVAIFNSSLNETTAAKTKAKTFGNTISEQSYLNFTIDCVDFQKKRGYIMSSLTQEEEQFPLAFSMLIYTDVEMVERLLRAIYRPQNVYCIHVDLKSSAEFYRAVSGIAKCFTNVFIAQERINVAWGTFSVLEPELVCMEELWRYPKWKYFINLTGQEFPLKTNFELVKILTSYNGASDVNTTLK